MENEQVHLSLGQADSQYLVISAQVLAQFLSTYNKSPYEAPLILIPEAHSVCQHILYNVSENMPPGINKMSSFPVHVILFYYTKLPLCFYSE